MAARANEILQKARQRLAEIQQERRRIEGRKQKLERDLEHLRVREAELRELLGEAPDVARATGRGVTRKTKARLEALQQILADAPGPMSPKELMEGLGRRLGEEQAGSRVALQDLLRRSPELFENVDRGRWKLVKDQPGDDLDSLLS